MPLNWNVSGGQELNRFRRHWLDDRKRSYTFGWWYSRYPNTLPVAQVACWNNYGTSRTRARLFWDVARQNAAKSIKSIEDSDKDIVGALVKNVQKYVDVYDTRGKCITTRQIYRVVA